MTSRPSGAGPTRREALRGHRPRRCVSRADAHVEIRSIALGERTMGTTQLSKACESDRAELVPSQD